MLTIVIIRDVRRCTQRNGSTTAQDAFLTLRDIHIVDPCAIRGMICKLDLGLSSLLAIPYQRAMSIA